MLCSNRVSVFVCAGVDALLSSRFFQQAAIKRLHGSNEKQADEREEVKCMRNGCLIWLIFVIVMVLLYLYLYSPWAAMLPRF